MAGPARVAERFVASHADVGAVALRIGARTAELILVDGGGAWERVVVASTEAAHTLGDHLGITVSDGWSDDLRRRVTNHRRSAREWEIAPYPERGRHRVAG